MTQITRDEWRAKLLSQHPQAKIETEVVEYTPGDESTEYEEDNAYSSTGRVIGGYDPFELAWLIDKDGEFHEWNLND